MPGGRINVHHASARSEEIKFAFLVIVRDRTGRLSGRQSRQFDGTAATRSSPCAPFSLEGQKRSTLQPRHMKPDTSREEVTGRSRIGGVEEPSTRVDQAHEPMAPAWSSCDGDRRSGEGDHVAFTCRPMIASRRALSRCHAKSASGLGLTDFQAAATASRQVVIAAARSTRRDELT